MSINKNYFSIEISASVLYNIPEFKNKEKNMKNKNVVIFGDSYSTYEGYIPSGYAYYYSGHRGEGVLPDLDSVDKTWWKMLMDEMGDNLVHNNSWSGSTICYTGYNNYDASNGNSFIFRFEKLLSEGFFKQNKIDTVLVFGGTNDNWANAPIGEIMYENIEKSDLYCVLPGISHFVKRLTEELPDTDIFFIINTELKQVITEGIVSICEHYGVPTIMLEAIDKINGHPTELGMVQIKDQVKKAIM